MGTTLHVGVRSPLAAMRASVEIIRTLTRGERVTRYSDAIFPVEDARLSFRSADPIPVILAGRGRRMIHLAGEIADGLITHGLAPAYLEMVVEQVASGREAGGRADAGCEIALMMEVAIDDDLDRGREALRPRCRYMVGGKYAEDLIPLYGLDPSAVMPIRAAVRAGDPNAASMIDDRMVDAFALSGPRDAIAKRLAVLGGFGIGAVVLSPGKQVSAAEIRELGLIIKEVRA